ncbi:MAG: bifunctional DNA-formamidopyrimidine glycosylase/DNA-(apurinic or apyrimidinic site) lyase [Acidobacteria bacterium]|nr:bifunctional DNA-formamidopyrimidine glycosylase/DNA-(apurinic or apyrimidinic site) lyase [Acidobacteriota bacterium]
MPELPEVETIVQGLRPRLTGQRIASAEFLWARTCVGNPDTTARTLAGQEITAVRRWGKYLVFDLQKESTASVLVIHLRMTGNLLFGAEPGPWTRVIFTLRDGPVLIFNDIRKFGRMEWGAVLPARLQELGPEPLEIGPAEFYSRLRSRSARIKAVLLDQEFLRGLGNIYCDEALFRARIHPKATTTRIGRLRAERLHAAIQQVLREAITQGGSTVVNYVNSEGTQGYFQLYTAVYGKTGQPCKACGRPIRKSIVAGRSTHCCPHCQRI